MVQHLTISDERFWFRGIIASTPLDAAPAMWPDELWPNWKLQDLRAAILHVITETACHAGHLDAVRELIDGRTWEQCLKPVDPPGRAGTRRRVYLPG